MYDSKSVLDGLISNVQMGQTNGEDMEIYISKIVWAGFVDLVRYGLGNRIARIISKHEE